MARWNGVGLLAALTPPNPPTGPEDTARTVSDGVVTVWRPKLVRGVWTWVPRMRGPERLLSVENQSVSN